ncbi:sugar phosphate isomerase/epimerase [Halobacillus salinarum]|uniref:Sugar phosphate isomerase/epimerase n=1 Tax=Halobacillus salinarum TaxID=2932257 RepID=A0ABY4ERF6_9BACI|nr:TIM barrel protein [Halobacillus salinarum]UOQ46292.1 sugar phosphate isomerase/epimerase [Halobacillus salinarum]
MKNTLAVSGSTIMSNPDQFDELFAYGVSHIEIGEFPDLNAFQEFLALAKAHNVTFGVHSPLIRGNSKYDLVESVSMDIVQARKHFEEEVVYLSEHGAEYLLVHFPYFKTADPLGHETLINEGLQYLNSLQMKYGLPIVCEPKLGQNQSPAGIEDLAAFDMEIWNHYHLSICIDLGDYRMAAGDKWKAYVEPLLPFVKVVHLHNVSYIEDGYIWIPVHPQFENKNSHFEMEPMIEILGEGNPKYFVLEHTPHSNPSKSLVTEGVEWVRKLIE